MQITYPPFVVTDGAKVEPTEHPGETGVVYWRTQLFGPIRMRIVEYSPGYFADHWCSKGHVLLCLEGELDTELRDGRWFRLTPGSPTKSSTTPSPIGPRPASGQSFMLLTERISNLLHAPLLGKLWGNS